VSEFDEADEAHIVNTGSLASLDASMVTGAPHTVAKFALLGLSETLHHELAAVAAVERRLSRMAA
jgi:NAD(P)-dependent dehydrogenase (short-subunit alcohol dehydrogenase family)